MKIVFVFFFFITCIANSYSLEIKRGRQLFVDDFLIEYSSLQRVYHSPQYSSENPILVPDKSWEYNFFGDPYAAPFSGGIWYDEEENKFKMWYSAGGNKKNGFVACYAESNDGKKWIKPCLDVVDNTNIIDTLEHDCFSVIMDKYEKDRSKRYKMFIVAFNSRSSVSLHLKYSYDGIHWTPTVACSGEIYDRTGVYYDPFQKKYVLSLKTINGHYRRARNYLSGDDVELTVSLAHRTFDNISDKYIKYWFHADDNDPRNELFPDLRPQIYNHEAIPYESLLLGYFTIWQGPENKECDSMQIQKKNEVLVGWSRDGFNWNRSNKTPFFPVGKNGDWNEGNVQSSNGSPIIVNDSLYFYMSGRYNKSNWDSNLFTGLAMLRRDGFVSMRAGKKEGFLQTKNITVNGSLYVNVDIKNGRLSVEVLNEEGIPLPGFSKEDCIILKHLDSTKRKVCWSGNKDINSLAGEKIKLKFYLLQGDLYSFWLSNNLEGKSNGYTAGGGPCLNKSGIDN